MRKYEIIDGYRLEVGPTWNDYSAEERANLCNGVGAANQHKLLARILGALPYLYSASKPHDIDYFSGGHSEDRLQADKRFMRNCFTIAKAEIGSIWKRWTLPVYRHKWLFAVVEIRAAYRVLRIAGGNAFNYRAMEEKGIENV